MSSLYEDYRVEILIASCITIRNWQIPDMSAPYWRFYWNDRPGAVINYGAEHYTLTPDYFYVIPAATPASTRLANPVFQHLNCNLIFSGPGVFLTPGIYPLRCSRDQLKRAKECAALYFTEHDHPAERLRRGLLIRALVHDCLAALPLCPEERDRGDERINKAVNFIAEKLENGEGGAVSTAALAQCAGLHRNSLARLFRHYLGHSPQEYIRIKRLDMACILLHDPALAIDEIARRLGYCDRYHFTREFRTARHLPPAAFRRALR